MAGVALDRPAAGLRSIAAAEGFFDAGFMYAVLQPGDALFIPLGWWHYVEATTASMSPSAPGIITSLWQRARWRGPGEH